MKTKLLLLFIVPFLVLSCKSKSDIIYFQTLGNSNITDQAINYEPKITPDDQLSISVSAADPEAVANFNLPALSYLTPGEKQLAVTPSLQTYLVDQNGNIDFPIIGKLHVAGLTRQQLAEQLKEKISVYVTDPLVNVQIMNFKVNVIGEVTTPGSFPVASDRISILDAISLAGDLTIYGNRSNVLLIRENNGKKEFYRYDLTDPALFSSPYYYLQQNDVIYVEPNKSRQGNSKYNQNKQFNISVMSTVISAVSVITSLCIALIK